MKLNLAYFGTPDFSARLLEKLLTASNLPINLQMVVTQPDRPVGRRQIPTPSPVKQLANKYGVEVWDQNLSTDTPLVNLLRSKKIDLVLLFAYGEIITDQLLQAPRYGFWNIHPSLLPKYRGAAPIVYPMILGDSDTGVTLMKMDAELDHGPIISQAHFTIQPDQSREVVEKELTDLGFNIFQKVISEGTEQGERSPLLEGRSPPLVAQEHSQKIFTKLLNKNDGFIEFNVLQTWLENQSIITANLPDIILNYCRHNSIDPQTIDHSPRLLYNLFRGLHPWPGIWSILPDLNKRLKINDMEYHDGKIILKRVQLEGKNEVDFPTFNAAYKIFK